VLALHADAVEALPTGAVRARGAPRFVTMRVAYDEQDPGQALAGDTFVPEELAPLLDHVIEAASLRRSTAIETVDAVRRFFAENFAYSLFLATASGAPSRTLSDFLLRDRKGHCEYFATSTALLLRRLGVPAQYTVGYSAQEFSSLENAFVVRSRHAHAWTRALVDGRWITVDTTPSRWAQDEEEAARGFFGPLTDRVSWAIDRLVQWWVGSTVADLAWGLGAIVVIALAPFAFMFVRRAWRRRAGPAERVTAHRAARAWQGVEAAMARRGHVRARGETVLAWARRLQGEAGVELVELARAYYRARFDPSAKESDIEEFERRVRPLSRATSRAPSGPDSRWRA
jgi:hypothetical protein